MMTNRILRAIKVKEEIEASLFTETDLRGLSKSEKEYIRENGYKCYVDISGFKGCVIRYYMFINRNLLGKKQLYALTKKQSLLPNGHDISESAYNYECWLLFNANERLFSKFNYERRFCTTPNMRMIFV